MTGEVLHASCVALDGRGLLILGRSGAGKSSLALAMIGLGAVLVSDDRTEVLAEGDRVLARCPRPELRGVIEARGLGLLRAPHVDAAPLALVVDLGQAEPQRLPPKRTTVIAGIALPLVLQPQTPHLAQALCLYLRGGRVE